MKRRTALAGAVAIVIAGCRKTVLSAVEVEAPDGTPPEQVALAADIIRRRLGHAGIVADVAGEPGSRRIRIDVRRGAIGEVVALASQGGRLDFASVARSDLPFSDALFRAAASNGIDVKKEWQADVMDCRGGVTCAAKVEALLSAATGADPRFTIGFDRFGGIARVLDWKDSMSHVFVESADVEDDQYGQPRVMLTLGEDAGRQFSDLTGKLVGLELAILVDGRVMSAPRVMERISGNTVQITMGGAGKPRQTILVEARALAGALATGEMPFKPTTSVTVWGTQPDR